MAGATIRRGGTPVKSAADELVDGANPSYVVNDAKGRAITLTKPNVLAQFRLVKILGEAAENRAYVGMVLPLLFVSDIDGEPIPFPQSERVIEGLIQRLDDDGIAAVMKGVTEHWGDVDPERASGEVKK